MLGEVEGVVNDRVEDEVVGADHFCEFAAIAFFKSSEP